MANVEDAKNQAREYLKLTQTNTVKLAGTVVSNYQSEPKAKMKDGMIVLNDLGEAQYYPSRCSVKVAFTGGEVEIPISQAQFTTTKVGEMYLFSGRQGLIKSFGSESVGVVYDTIEEL